MPIWIGRRWERQVNEPIWASRRETWWRIKDSRKLKFWKKLNLRHLCASRRAAGMSVPRCGSAGGLLAVHWAGPWLGKIGRGLQLRRARTEPQGYFRICSWWWSVGLPSEAQTCESPTRFLGRLDCPRGCSWEGLVLCHGATSGSAVRPMLVGLPQGYRWAHLPAGPWVAGLLLDHGVEGWSWVMELLQDPVRAKSMNLPQGHGWACLRLGSWAVTTGS